MKKEILISIDEYENRVAILEEGRLCEIYISREDRILGSIYKGKVTNILSGMQAAFVNIGLDKSAFLCVDDVLIKNRLDEDIESIEEHRRLSIKDILKANQETLVQVIKEPIGSKGPRVTTQIALPGRYLVYLPMAQYIGVSRKIKDEKERERLKNTAKKIRRSKDGLIVRTVAEYKDKEELEKDYLFLTRLWKKIAQVSKKKKAPYLVHQELTLVYQIIRDVFSEDFDKLIVDSINEYERILEFLELFSPDLKNKISFYQDELPLFQHYGIEKEIEKALKKKVWLASGGYIVIEKTEALIVIDVNTGKYVGRTSLAETILKTNLEATREIAHQLRLRDIGGIIIIDFIDMDFEEDKKKVLDKLEEELKKDRNKTFIIGMTELGLVQLTRKRSRKDLTAYLSESCPYCSGEGRIYSIETVKIKFEREIKRLNFEDKFDYFLVTAHPKVALAILGWEGEDLERLEKEMGKSIYMRADETSHHEKIEIRGLSDTKIEKNFEELWPGQILSVKIIDSFGYNPQNGIGIYKGNIIEVVNAGNMMGKDVNIVITMVSRSYNQAQIKD